MKKVTIEEIKDWILANLKGNYCDFLSYTPDIKGDYFETVKYFFYTPKFGNMRELRLYKDSKRVTLTKRFTKIIC